MKNSSFAFFFGIWSLCLFDVGAFFCPIIKTEKDFGFADWGNDKNCVIFFVECSPRKVTQCICMVCERLIGHEWLPFPNCAGTIYTNIRLTVYDRTYTTDIHHTLITSVLVTSLHSARQIFALFVDKKKRHVRLYVRSTCSNLFNAYTCN